MYSHGVQSLACGAACSAVKGCVSQHAGQLDREDRHNLLTWEVIYHSFPFHHQAADSTRMRNKSNFARPYMLRLINFKRLMARRVGG
jgi:hypothetical protein